MPFRTTPHDASQHGPARWWDRAWIAPAALAVLPWVVFLPAALMRGVFAHGDTQAYFYPYHVLPAALLKRGELPLWNPYTFSGLPLLADGQTALFYPVNWLFFVLPASVALNYDILIQFSIAGTGMYLLLRALGLWRLPAFVGAAVFMFCGSLTARVIHLSILSGAALMPLALYCTERAFRGRQEPRPSGVGLSGPLQQARAGRLGRAPWFVASALVISLQVFAGHPQVPVYTAMMLGLYALVRGVERWLGSGGPGWLFRLPAIVAGAYLLGGALAAIQLVPWAELGAMSTRAAGASFDMVFNTSMARSEWVLQLFPYLYGTANPGFFGQQPASIVLTVRFIEHSAYAGILPLGLAVYACVGLPSSRAAGPAGRQGFYSVLFFALLATLGLLLAVGWATPLAHLVYRTPVLGKLRAVERALVLVDFAVAGLAAFGLQRLLGSVSPARPRRWSLAAIGAGLAALPAAVVLLAPQAWFQRVMHFPREATANLAIHRPNAFVPILLASASAALLIWWSRRRVTRSTLALATGLVLLDLGGYAALYNVLADAGFYDQRPAVLAAFPDEPGHFRKATFLPGSAPGDHLPLVTLAMSWGMVYRVEDVNGFNSLQTRRYTDYLFGPDVGDVSYGLLKDDRLFRPESPILSALNVRYVLVPAGTPVQVGRSYRRVWANADVTVYENSLAYPRAFFAEGVRGMTDAAAILAAVTSDGFDGRRLALIEAGQAPALPAPGPGDEVALTAWSANGLSLVSNTAAPRFLVLSEMYFPGWEASVDGAATPIYRTNYLFRGIVVPAGRHTVTFAYRPRSVLAGAGISALALVAAAMILLAGRRSR
jgi:hypothetical protein